MTIGAVEEVPADEDRTARFEDARPRLLGLAYRMLGTLADAEDVVQEAWLKWDAADVASIDNVDAWLTTVTTRLALGRLRSAQRRREDYVGPWLPEPVVSAAQFGGAVGGGGGADAPDARAVLAESLTFGFLAMLDQLHATERAVFLLADVFAVPYAEVAAAVGKSEVACRQIASRARRRLRDGKLRPPTGAERQVVDELLVAVALGDMNTVLARLAPDVVTINDGGALRRAARRPVVGRDRVARFICNLARRYPNAMFMPATVNGDPGVIATVDGEIDFVAAFEVEHEQVAAIWVVRNPEKLEHVLETVAIE